MKKLILFVFLLLAVILFLLLSCTHDVKQKGVSFDKTEFTAQKEKWNSAQIKNYSFDYSFGSYRPDYIVGNVTVTEDNKKANVVCTEESEKYSSGYKLDNTSKYYLDSIEDIFATLYSEYERAIKRVENGDFEYIEIKCSYNEKYGYPEYIANPGKGGSSYIEDKEGNMAGNSNEDFIFYLKNFSLNK